MKNAPYRRTSSVSAPSENLWCILRIGTRCDWRLWDNHFKRTSMQTEKLRQPECDLRKDDDHDKSEDQKDVVDQARPHRSVDRSFTHCAGDVVAESDRRHHDADPD